MNGVHAVIIAGGEGRRLGGVRKADLIVGGVRLIERVARVLEGVKRPVLVATGPNSGAWDLPAGCEGISDLPLSGGGPLAGLVAAVEALKNKGLGSGMLVTAAVDTPFLPEDFVSRLVSGLAERPAAFASWGESFYPTNAVWRIEAIVDLPDRRQDVGSLKSLLTEMDAQRVSWDEAPLDPFANVNTQQDLTETEERARRATDL